VIYFQNACFWKPVHMIVLRERRDFAVITVFSGYTFATRIIL